MGLSSFHEYGSRRMLANEPSGRVLSPPLIPANAGIQNLPLRPWVSASAGTSGRSDVYACYCVVPVKFIASFAALMISGGIA
jgi:hypothetical protein